jgi:beta-glucosidase-like glycosyl hydrolase
LRWRNRRGSILLETGLVLPVFGLLLVGGFDFGRLMMAQQNVEAAARAGAEVAVVNAEFTEADVRAAVEKAGEVTVERFEEASRRYVRVRVQADCAGLLGVPRKTLRAAAVVRLP